MVDEKQPKSKKPFYKKWWFWVIVVIVLIAICPKGDKKDTGQMITKSETKSDVTYKIGEIIKTNKFEIKITVVKERSKVGNEYFSSNPAEGGTYVTVQWQYKNISDEPIGMFSTPSINLVDSNGVKYDSDIGASGSFATELNLTKKAVSDLNPGITVTDADVFEISKESWKKRSWTLLVNADKKLIIGLN